MYGIYDLSGGLYERTAGYVANGSSYLASFNLSFTGDGESSKYVKVYAHNNEIDNDTSDATADVASEANYKKNANIYGNAINEISTAGSGSTSWCSGYSYFPALSNPVLVRGGTLWEARNSGLLLFERNTGRGAYNGSFRPVVVAL